MIYIFVMFADSYSFDAKYDSSHATECCTHRLQHGRTGPALSRNARSLRLSSLSHENTTVNLARNNQVPCKSPALCFTPVKSLRDPPSTFVDFISHRGCTYGAMVDLLWPKQVSALTQLPGYGVVAVVGARGETNGRHTSRTRGDLRLAFSP